VQRLGDLGWEEAIIFPEGDPKSVEIWGGDDHWHAQTHYLVTGRRIGVTQAGVGGEKELAARLEWVPTERAEI
jgi:hypothetical protein